jgi:pyruvate/2-oxoglutarate dehydrogenase complex dihydrolipoamide dehydrogenase (E3) component
LNVGCIPSKMLIFPADRIIEIQEASKLGIKAEIQEVVDAMATTGTILPLINGIHIHPALPEVIVDTLRNLKEMDQMNSDQSPTDGF